MRMLIAGAIRNKAFSGFSDNGRELTRKEAETELRRLLAEGHKYLLVGDPKECPNFDPKGEGCPGHPDNESESSPTMTRAEQADDPRR